MTSARPSRHTLNRRHVLVAGVAASTVGMPAFVQAAPAGSSSADLVIGQTAGLSGPFGPFVKRVFAGASLALDSANARGGVGGRRVRLVSLDDALNPATAAANCKRLIEDEGALALYGSVGATIAPALPMLRQAGMALVAPYALPDALREQAKGVAFCTRASFQREIEVLVRQLTTIGVTRIGFAHVTVATSAEATLNAELQKHQLSATGVAKIAPDGSNLAEGIKALNDAHPQAVILALDTTQASRLAQAMWAMDGAPRFYGTSLMDGELLWRKLDGKTKGFVVAQVTPYPWNGANPDMLRFQALCKAAGLPPSYQALEGYLGARVLLEGLQRAGRDPTRAGVQRAVSNLNMRLAGIDINFAGGAHTGSRFVELVQVTEEGRFLR